MRSGNGKRIIIPAVYDSTVEEIGGNAKQSDKARASAPLKRKLDEVFKVCTSISQSESSQIPAD